MKEKNTFINKRNRRESEKKYRKRKSNEIFGFTLKTMNSVCMQMEWEQSEAWENVSAVVMKCTPSQKTEEKKPRKN